VSLVLATRSLTCSLSSSYDRLSPPYQAFLESLTATCAQPVFESATKAGGYEITSPRGSPLNHGLNFSPVHPVIRTHPVTGWKSLFAGVGLHVSRINDVYSYEDQMIRDYVLRLITRNHDCIARMHWTKQACAIWSNACTLHAATVCHLCADQGSATRCVSPHNLNPRSAGMLLTNHSALARHTSCGRSQSRCARLGCWREAISGSRIDRKKRSTWSTQSLACKKIALMIGLPLSVPARQRPAKEPAPPWMG
jgi:hypothetical protein